MRRYNVKQWMCRGAFLIASLIVPFGCNDDSTGPRTIALTLNPDAATIHQGASAPVTVTITGSGGFRGTPTLAATGAPAGVTGTVSSVTTSGNVTTATVTVQVGASTALGAYSITVRAQASGVADATAVFSLTVSAAPDYALSLASAALEMVQGTSTLATVTITRTNFTGAVTLSLGGATAGVTGSFDPVAPEGTSSTLTLNVAAAVAPGVYNLTVDGTGAPGNRSAPLRLTVNRASSPVIVDFSGCTAAARAVWLAYRDGTGTWTPVTGVNDAYAFGITSDVGAIAYVSIFGSFSNVAVYYMTKAELTANAVRFCIPTQTLKTVTGFLADVNTKNASISMGGGTTTTLPGAVSFQLPLVKEGTHDLVAARRSFASAADRAIIRRDQNIGNNQSMGLLDFAGAESFATVTAMMTVVGPVASETLDYSMTYQVGATCESAPLNPFISTSATFTAAGIPAAQQRESDYHRLTVRATGTNEERRVTESFHALAPRTVTLGAPLPAPTITALSGAYKRLQVVFTKPADYNTRATFGYRDAAGARSVGLSATADYLSGANVTFEVPDFSTVAGWDNSWAPAVASTVEWATFASGSSGPACTENATLKSAQRNGTF